MVPIFLDALALAHDQRVAQGLTDFSRLPYSTSLHDVNADIANLSEEVVRAPFQETQLNAGIHLHWALPDALTRAEQRGDSTVFPRVPNRWAVIRASGDTPSALTIEQQWVVESDYLYPSGQRANSVTTPVRATAGQPPFRYLGRSVPLASWQEDDPQAEYLAELTAVGYGEPTFAALYANCYSVFGFYDNDYTETLPAGLQYTVFGWYSDSDQDVLSRFLATLQEGGTALSNADLSSALAARFGWSVSVPAADAFPDLICCYAQIDIQAVGAAASDEPAPRLAVGNTGTEALSAYLAQAIDPTNKADIEDQLEAVLLAQFLDQQYLDIGPNFQAARHERGFSAVPGGSLWTIRAESTNAPADAAATSSQPTLPDALAHALNLLNTLQHSYDDALARSIALQEQVFADWYKYMLAAYPPAESQADYPDVDLIRYFIAQKGLVPLATLQASTGALSLQWTSDGSVTGASAGASAADSLAAALAAQITSVLQALAEFNASAPMQATALQYTLKLSGGARYWQPNEPVVLLTGAAVEPTDRHGQDGALPCQALDNVTLHPVTAAVIADLLAGVAQIQQTASSDQVGFFQYDSPPWNPLLLEWRVEVFPLQYHSNLDPDSDGYGSDFITSNYTLAESAVDLAVQPEHVAISRSANIYSGWSILTARAEEQYQSQLNAYLARYPGDATIQQAAALVNDPGFHCLAQSLGGFNQALLMRKQTYQLDIADPLGFSEYQRFSAQVAAAVAGNNRSAPLLFSDFNPLRSGAMRVQRLRLVDTFGQIKDLDVRQIVRTEQMTTPGSDYLVWLQPRLVQPARINVRWLAALQGEQEMNDHPATTPICGWVLPNNLDGSLMIYASTGQALGLIDAQLSWRSAPGGAAIQPSAIDNPFLRQLVEYLLARDTTFLRDFIATLDSALDAIDPENAAAHTAVSLLFGRPIALVRAMVDLELQGLPAVQQSWNALRRDMQRMGRTSDHFAEVQFPIRLGEYQQLNDGLVGYWIEADAGYADDLFYAPQSSDPAHTNPLIKTHTSDSALTFTQTLNTPATTVSMLVDPRGSVHVTCGIQPVKAITIPADQYADALAQIEVTFLTAPILTNQGAINLPLPTEAGYSWSWVEQQSDGWSEIDTIGQINPQGTFEAPQTLHDGWLKLSPSTQDSDA